MYRYSMIRSVSEIADIPKEFKQYFGVDLDCEEFKRYETIEEKWKAVIDATGMGQNIIDDKYVYEAALQGTDEIFNEYQMYGLDVWLNAYFSLKFLEPCKEDYFGDGREIYTDIEKQTKHVLPISGGDIFTEFCKEYKRTFFEKNNKAIFNPCRLYHNNCVNGLHKGMENILQINTNASLTLFSHKRISQFEQNSKFKTEDKILFYKTIDCVCARYLTAYYYFEEEDVRNISWNDLIHMAHERKICGIKSFAWKNMCIISRMPGTAVNFIIFSQRIVGNANIINERLRVLTRGLIYCMQGYSQEEYSCLLNETVRKYAEKAVEELMNVDEEVMALFPEQKKDVLRLNNAEPEILKLYALVQARVIFYKFYT